MARQRKRERNTKHSPLAASQPNRLARFWHPGCLMFATALLVATPLVPSERTEITGAALPYIMLWLVLALVWFAGGALLKVQPGKLSWIDAAMLALVAWQAVSGIVMQQHGAPRPTINAVWTWVSFGVIVVMLRQLLSDRRESRSLCAVMIALAVCLSVIAFYQAAITLPGDRAAYEADPEKSLSEANVHAPEGSAARKQFEARLYSSEPTATFSLTNSLAGFLAPWFVLLLGIAATRILPLPLGEGRGEGSEEEAAQGSGFRVQEFRFATFYSLLGIACLIAICLLLTKSRTAWLATLVGVAAIGAVVLFARANRRQALLAVGGFASLAAIAIFLATIFLPNVSSTAALSLKYRLEYWQSTAAMIADYPIFGCGPGNFQSYYTTYKLPQASEAVADPHNFLMEVAATAGLPGLMLFMVMLGIVAWGGSLKRRDAGGSFAASATDGEERGKVLDPDYLGSALGCVLAVALGLVAGYPPDILPLFLGAIAGGVCLGLLRPWVLRGRLPVWLAALALVVLLINLLAAGGISFPGVAMTLWILIAILTVDANSKSWTPSPVASLVLITPVVVGLLLTCHQTAYQPVLRRKLLMADAQVAFAEARTPTGSLGRVYEELLVVFTANLAAQADPWSPEPHLLLARIHGDEWNLTFFDAADSKRQLELCQRHCQLLLQRDAHSFQSETAVGYIYLAIDHAIGDETIGKQSIAHFEAAVSLYPNDAMTHAHLAMAYHFAEDSQAADAATEALRLDALCPHEERKLANRQVFAEIGVAGQSDALIEATRGQSAEGWMLELLERGKERSEEGAEGREAKGEGRRGVGNSFRIWG